MRNLKRIMAMLLACVMVFGLVPVTMLAADEVATYYVAAAGKGGSPENTGLSETSPLLGIDGALDAAKASGKSSVVIKLVSNIPLTQEFRFADYGVRDVTIIGSNHMIYFDGSDAYAQTVGTGTGLFCVTGNMTLTLNTVDLCRNGGNELDARLLYVDSATVNIVDSKLHNAMLDITHIKDSGSTIYVGNNATVTLDGNTTVYENTSTGSGSTGAIYVAKNGSLELRGCEIDGNYTNGTKGAGIYVAEDGSLTVDGSADAINVAEEIFIALGANAVITTADGASGNVTLSRVFLDSDSTSAGRRATLDIAGDTRNSVIGIEVDEADRHHEVYRLISNPVSGYGIKIDKATGMDEDGWSDLCGRRDIRYMVHDGVPGLYFYYHTLDVTFQDVNTLTGITGTDIGGNAVNILTDAGTSAAQNSSFSGGVLSIPEFVAVDDGDFTINFTVDEAGKVYRMPDKEQIAVKIGGVTLTQGTDYEYVQDVVNGKGTITIFADALKGKTGTVEFLISGEKYHKLTLVMQGPLYTMQTTITGEVGNPLNKEDYALSIVQNQVTNDDGTASIQFRVMKKYTRDDGSLEELAYPDVKLVAYRADTDAEVASTMSDSTGVCSINGLDPAYSYYTVAYYEKTYDVIERDEVSLMLSPRDHQKLAATCDYNASEVTVSYSLADAEYWDTDATATLSGVKADTVVKFYVDRAQDRIFFHANQQDATTAADAKFYFNGTWTTVDTEGVLTKEMEREAMTYGELPDMEMEGYEFLGWFTEPQWNSIGQVVSTTAYVTSSSPRDLYAHWEPINVDYTVEHWVELTGTGGINPYYTAGTTRTKVINGVTYYLWRDNVHQYTADATRDSVLDKAMTASEFVDPEHNFWTIDGFTVTAQENCKVLADGSSVFDIVYTRNEYTMTYNPTDGQMSDEKTTQTHKFAAVIGPMLVANRSGYEHSGWYQDVGVWNGIVVESDWYSWARDVDVYAYWTATNTSYKIAIMKEGITYDAEGRASGNGIYVQTSIMKQDLNGNAFGAISDTPQTVGIGRFAALKQAGFTYVGYSAEKLDSLDAGVISNSTEYEVTANEWGASDSRGTTIYLYYTRNVVTVHFHEDDVVGSPAEDVNIVYDTTWGPYFTHPTKPGYDHNELNPNTWLTASGYELLPGTETDAWTSEGFGEMDVYPVWEARQYNLTYVPGDNVTFVVSNMGEDVEAATNSAVPGGYKVTKQVTYDQPMGTMPLASKVGYEFIDWVLPDGSPVRSDTTVSVDNVIVENTANSMEETRALTAKFEAYQFTLTFDAMGGTVSPSFITVTYDSATPELPTPVRAGYTFMGWSLASNPENLADTVISEGDRWSTLTSNGGEIKAYAMWVANSYTYQFDLNDDRNGNGSTRAFQYDASTSGAQIVFDSAYATVLNNVVAQRNGYDFLGWSLSRNLSHRDNPVVDFVTAETLNTLPSGSTVYAVWRPQVRNLEIHLNSGTLSTEWAWNYTAYAAAQYTAYKNAYGRTLTASYTSADVWNVPIIMDTVYGPLDTLTREHYKFEGYSISNEGWFIEQVQQYPDNTPVYSMDALFTDWSDSKVVLNAVWTPIFDFVLVDGNVADGAQFADGTTATKKILRTDLIADGVFPTVTYNGYTFLGWYDTALNRYVTFDEVTAMSEYHEFKAFFTPNITFNANGGKVRTPDGQDVDSFTMGLKDVLANYIDFPMATKDGLTCTGWVASNGADMHVFSNLASVQSPLTLTAQWDKTVTFCIPNNVTWSDGTGGNRTYTVLEVINWSELPSVYLPGYTLLGWFSIPDASGDPGTQETLASISHWTTSGNLYPKFVATLPGEGDTAITPTIVDHTNGVMSVNAPAVGWQLGENTFTVTCDSACVVILKSGLEYTVIPAVSVNTEGNVGTFTCSVLGTDEIHVVLRGDANVDGVVNSDDATRILQDSVGLYTFSDIGRFAADANIDGVVNSDDATRVLQSSVSLYTIPWKQAD